MPPSRRLPNISTGSPTIWNHFGTGPAPPLPLRAPSGNQLAGVAGS